MRKSVLALTAAGGVFALTAAAASTLTVNGPFNPRAGADARTCDLGALTVTTQDDGTKITGFTVAAATASDATGQECTGSTVYVAINDTAAAALPSGWDGTADIGSPGDAGDWRFSAPASSFTAANEKQVAFTFAAAATNKIYGWTPPVPLQFHQPYTQYQITAAPSIASVGVGSAAVLLSESTPTTGAFLTPVPGL